MTRAVRMSVIRGLFGWLVALAMCLTAGAEFGARADSGVIIPDLAFHFVCEGKDPSELEIKMDIFLRRQEFKVLNKGRIQREHGVYLTDLTVIGLDSDQRIIEFNSFPFTAGRYSVRLNSPPPTVHATQLESAMLDFAADELGCGVRQVSRGENRADAHAFYNKILGLKESMFLEAERLRGERRL
jgi:hypothetical protein